MLDIRTILTLTLPYSFIAGAFLIIFGYRRESTVGLKTMGVGVLTYGIGFLLLALREELPAYITIIFANYFSFFGVSLVLKGFAMFKNVDIKWWIQTIIMSLLLLGSLVLYTFFQPNISMRILSITLLMIIIFLELVFLVIYKSKERGMIESMVLSIFFFISILIFVARAFLTFQQVELETFMEAGCIHSLTIMVYQVLPFSLCVTTFWISNSKMEQELVKLSMIDALTGLYNRAAILKIISKSVESCKRSKGSFAIVMADLDFFKRVNDLYGHQVGDKVLSHISNILSTHIRKGDFLGRYGGEEFIMILFDVDEVVLKDRLNALRKDVEGIEYEGQFEDLKVTISIGCVINGTCYESEYLIRLADQALYKAKNNGRNRVEVNQFAYA